MTVACVLLLLPSGVRAEQMRPEVLEIAEEGRQLFDDGQFREAIELLDQGYEEYHQAIFLQYIGRCYQELEEPCAAADFYRRFLEQGDLTGEEQEELESRSVELEAQCEAMTPDEPDEPDEPVGPAPTGPPRNFGGNGEPEPPSHRGTDIAGFVLMGIAGATLVSGVALWGVAYGMAGQNPEVADNERPRCESTGSCHAIAIAGDVLLFGATSAFLAIGAIVLGVGRRNARDGAAQVSFAPGPGGFSLSLAWR